jgi:excisionase family DNA binding protein
MVNKHKKYLNRKEVAEYLMVSQAKVTSMVQGGVLKAEIKNYQYKFLKTEVEQYKNKNTRVLKI